MKSKFLEVYGSGSMDVRHFFSPGRVNLIGEHTDYNGGYVFPCALSLGTYGLIRLNEDNTIRLYSNEIGNEVAEFNFSNLEYSEEDGWTNYPKGVIREFIKRGYKIDRGFDVLIYSTLPKASGLSSSASLEVLMGFMMKSMFDLDISLIDLAVLCKNVENNYIGVNCGILDQFAVSMGREDHAIHLDCNTLKYEYVPVKLDGVNIVLLHTNKERSLIDSKYNERRDECQSALDILRECNDIQTLGDMTKEGFDIEKCKLDETLLKRAKHAVYENQRTIEAKELLENGDLEGFGKLMKASHISLRDDYEVTGIELDTLANLAWSFDGCIGARMTGAGFGGCTVNLVKSDRVEDFRTYIMGGYRDKIGYDCRVILSDVGSGPRELY